MRETRVIWKNERVFNCKSWIAQLEEAIAKDKAGDKKVP